MADRQYSEEIRAAVIAALLAGQSVSSVAREYKIPKGTVSGWKSGGREIATQKKDVGEKLQELISAQLDSAIARVKLFGDTEWLKKHSPAEVATLHGVDLDKIIRLLEAFAAGQEDECEQ